MMTQVFSLVSMCLSLCLVMVANLGSAGAASVFEFGAVCDGIADDRQAIQNTIDNTPLGGTISIPKTTPGGVCAVGGAPGQVFSLVFTKPVHLICDPGVAITPNASVGDDQSVLYFEGNPNGVTIPTIVEGCFIGSFATGVRFGLHGMVFDTQAKDAAFRGLTIRNVSVQAGKTRHGAGIYMINNAANNVNGGIYAAVIGDGNVIQGGISLNSVGDSITIRKGTIPLTHVS
jgi:hypothetical protein